MHVPLANVHRQHGTSVSGVVSIRRGFTLGVSGRVFGMFMIGSTTMHFSLQLSIYSEIGANSGDLDHTIDC